MRTVYEKCSAALNADFNEKRGSSIDCSLLTFIEVVMDNLKFYTVPYDYIQFLQEAEKAVRGFSRVPNLDYGVNRNQKFVCGVVLSINNINYFAPITSYKTKKPDNFLILNDKQNRVLSSLRFNYMFPIPTGIEKPYLFSDIADRNYRFLVTQEYQYCVSNQDEIRRLAYRTYKRVLLGKDKGLVHNSCAFSLLEQKCEEYTKDKAQEQSNNQSLADKIKSAQQKADKVNQEADKNIQSKRDKGQEL